ncbi:MAG TPA: DUF2142 domain-containing protein [Solirubrobacter sp.]|nr:DUF2142 domain-containing protein [Solirubrobacter sp.]
MAERRRVPPPLAALIAASLLLALVWAFVTPPFQAPDENAHFGYTQTLAESGELPGAPGKGLLSSEQIDAGSASNSDQAAAQRGTKMEWNPRVWKQWRAADATRPKTTRTDGGGPNPASANPPLYYALEAVAYDLTPGGDLFSRLLSTRIMSLLWLAVTVSAVWALCGEALGRDSVLQLAAAGLAGLAPMLTFVSASVSPDAMLFALWSVALWLGVRSLRRGLTTWGALALFAVVGAAIVVKAASYALLPGALFVVAVAWKRRGLPWRPALAGAAGLAVTAGAWFVIASALNRPAAAQVQSAAGGGAVNVRELLSYVWQFYLPRPPFMNAFPTNAHTIPVYDVWLKGTWAAFGWTEVLFRNRVYVVLAAVTVAVVIGAAMQLWRTRHEGDRTIFAFLAIVTVSLLAGLHWSEYRMIKAGASGFNQGRYLLPLVGVAGLVLALAIKRFSPRLRPYGTAVAVGGLMVLQMLSLALVMVRFYA